MDHLLRYVRATDPAASHLSVACFFSFFFHNSHTDLDVAGGELDGLCLYQNVMHIKDCEYK